jgi:hypothetical protein
MIRDLLVDSPSTGGIINGAFAGYPTIRKGEIVRHGVVEGIVDDILQTSSGGVRIGIRGYDGVDYFAYGHALTRRPGFEELL